MKSFLRLSALLLIPAFVIVFAWQPKELRAQTDDFSDGNDDGWSHYNPIASAIYTVANGTYRIQAPASSPQNPSRAGAFRDELSYNDFYVSVDIVNWTDTVDQAIGLLARVNNLGAGTTTGYAFTYDRGTTGTSGDMDISRIAGEVPSGVSVSGNDLIHFVPGQSYRLVFIGKGSQLEGRVYHLPDVTTPVIVNIGTDSMFPSGKLGLVIFDTAGTSVTDATFDNYFANVAESPRLSVLKNGFGDFIVSWATNVGPFRLESTTNLSVRPIPWIQIQVGIDVIGTNFEYSETPEEPMKYFRLIQD